MNLYNHQKNFIKSNPDKSALIHSPGTGKTCTAIEWSKRDSGPALVIVPKSLVYNWQKELRLWGGRGTVISKENFRKLHKTLAPAGQVIVDECAIGFLTPHFKSQMSKALRWYLGYHKVPRLLLLTATPYSNPWNIFTLATLLGYKLNYLKFKLAFFNEVRMGHRIIPVVKKGIEKKLADFTKKIVDVVNINDIMDCPPQIHEPPEWFKLNAEQEKAIKANYDPLPIVRFTKQHEIEQGLFVRGRIDKTDRIVELVEENPKIAVVCRYRAQIDLLARVLAGIRPLYQIHGGVKERGKIAEIAENAEEAVVLVQADLGYGFELPSFPLCVFASLSYSFQSHEQMAGRFMRMNLPSKTVFKYLLTDAGVDTAVFQCVQKKTDFQAHLYEKMVK